MRTILFVILSVLMLGCSSAKTPGQSINCTGENWTEIGLTTARAAKSIRHFDTYVEQCGAQLEAGAKAAYIDGYTVGIIEFCNYENGYQLGLRNRENPQVCPAELRASFDKGYKVGLFELKEKMNEMSRHSRDAERKEDMMGSQQEVPAEDDR